MTRLHLTASITLLALLAAGSAHADYHIISPYEVDVGELEIEHNGSAALDHRKDFGGANSYTSEFGTGLTPWWHSEVELGFDRDSGSDQPTLLREMVWENMIQVTEPGAAFFDTGVYFEYSQSLTSGQFKGSNQVTFGPVVAKEIGRTIHTANLLFTRTVGPNQTTRDLDMSYRWQSRWNLWAPLSPAIEAYGDVGTLSSVPGFARQQFLVGPVAIGALKFSQLGWGNSGGKLKYEAGWLFGATRATAEGTLRWRAEVELPF